ncbi:hypothetical protein NP493_616g02000 [Ridgeia piscesae]|uniref:Uncharacterized protein n=1 Tax=Ridgeia piscesae TaxID=27915 RepID=A0AAD9KT33_RIDPI|nr:hypothetical protein NP493_616g02000 [Ridgeia piscesae]
MFGADSASKCNRLDNFHMYLPKKMCPSRPIQRVLPGGSMAGLGLKGTESYQCIPAKRWNFCALSGEQVGDNTQHLLTAALTNYLILNKQLD